MTELKTWVQCFAIYVGVVSLRHPEVIADMMAYMVMIVKVAEEYAALAWVRYDEASAARLQQRRMPSGPKLTHHCLLSASLEEHIIKLTVICACHPYTLPRTVCWEIPHLVIQQRGSSLWKRHSWQSLAICGGPIGCRRGSLQGCTRHGMGAAVLTTHASTNMHAHTAWDPIQHVDALSEVTLRLGEAVPK